MRRLASLRHAAALLWLVAASACAADLHSLWAVKGAHNTVYLFGSVHLLRSQDSALPKEVLRAYDRAAAVVMEADISDTAALQAGLMERAVLPAGQTLAGVLGPQLYGRFVAVAKPVGLDPGFIMSFQPWFAVTFLEAAKLSSLGYEPDAGIEMQLASRARADGKRIIGLETIADQVSVLSGMSLDEQRDFVAGELDDLERSGETLDGLVAAWSRGDAAAIEASAADAFKAYPAVHRRLVVDRNRKWMDTITRLLDEPNDYLVVVGVLHLVGRDSVVELLKKKGYTVVQQ
jgi:hypothetical protein